MSINEKYRFYFALSTLVVRHPWRDESGPGGRIGSVIGPASPGAHSPPNRRGTTTASGQEMAARSPLTHYSYYVKWKRGKKSGKLPLAHCTTQTTKQLADGARLQIKFDPHVHTFSFDVEFRAGKNADLLLQAREMQLALVVMVHPSEGSREVISRKTLYDYVPFDLRDLMSSARTNVRRGHKFAFSNFECLLAEFVIQRLDAGASPPPPMLTPGMTPGVGVTPAGTPPIPASPAVSVPQSPAVRPLAPAAHHTAAPTMPSPSSRASASPSHHFGSHGPPVTPSTRGSKHRPKRLPLGPPALASAGKPPTAAAVAESVGRTGLGEVALTKAPPKGADGAVAASPPSRKRGPQSSPEIATVQRAFEQMRTQEFTTIILTPLTTVMADGRKRVVELESTSAQMAFAMILSDNAPFFDMVHSNRGDVGYLTTPWKPSKASSSAAATAAFDSVASPVIPSTGLARRPSAPGGPLGAPLASQGSFTFGRGGSAMNSGTDDHPELGGGYRFLSFNAKAAGKLHEVEEVSLFAALQPTEGHHLPSPCAAGTPRRRGSGSAIALSGYQAFSPNPTSGSPATPPAALAAPAAARGRSPSEAGSNAGDDAATDAGDDEELSGVEFFVYQNMIAPKAPVGGSGNALQLVFHIKPTSRQSCTVSVYGYFECTSSAIKFTLGGKVYDHVEKLLTGIELIIRQLTACGDCSALSQDSQVEATVGPAVSKADTEFAQKLRLDTSSLDFNLWNRMRDYRTARKAELVHYYLERLVQQTLGASRGFFSSLTSGPPPAVNLRQAHVATLENLLVLHRDVEAIVVLVLRLFNAHSDAVGYDALVVLSATVAETVRSVMLLHPESVQVNSNDNLKMDLELQKAASAMNEARRKSINAANAWGKLEECLGNPSGARQALSFLAEFLSSDHALLPKQVEMLRKVLGLHVNDSGIARDACRLMLKIDNKRPMAHDAALLEAVEVAFRLHPFVADECTFLLKELSSYSSAKTAFEKRFGTVVSEAQTFECSVMMTSPAMAKTTLFLTRHFLCIHSYIIDLTSIVSIKQCRHFLQPALEITTSTDERMSTLRNTRSSDVWGEGIDTLAELAAAAESAVAAAAADRRGGAAMAAPTAATPLRLDGPAAAAAHPLAASGGNGYGAVTTSPIRGGVAAASRTSSGLGAASVTGPENVLTTYRMTCWKRGELIGWLERLGVHIDE